MRVSTIALCVGVFVGSLLLVTAAVATGLLCGVSRVLTLSEWSVDSMTIEALEYHDDSIRARIVVGVHAFSPNSTRVSSLSVPISNGEFWLSLDGEMVADGNVSLFTLSHDSTSVELILDQDNIPIACSDVLKRFIAGQPVEVGIGVKSLTVGFIPFPVDREASASVRITDGVKRREIRSNIKNNNTRENERRIRPPRS